jgi:two-component system cell cycle response regulator
MTARILIVDDTPLNLKLLTAKLEREYYVVTAVTNGFEALEAIEREAPDIILLEVCRQIRANPSVAYIPIVMVTALTDVTDRVKGLQAGADDFLSKPINDTALMARVRSLLRLKSLMDEWRLREKTSRQFTNAVGLTESENMSVAGSRVIVLEEPGGDRDAIVKALEQLACQAEAVERIADATSMARTGYYDAIFASLDLRNEEDALTVCAQLRANDLTRHIPVIFIGTEAEMPLVAKGLDIGGNDYILRPLDSNELISRTRTQLRHKRHYDSLRKNYEASLSLSLVDALTGAFNRRYVDAHLPRMLVRTVEASKPLAALMIDIDHFKKINDTYHHAAGDLVLKSVAERIINSVRPSDLAARIGGEEFLVIMPETPVNVAHLVAERLREKIAKTEIILPGHDKPVTVTVSIGCAATDGQEKETTEAILQRADDALYKAKNEGRNRVILA